MGGFVLAEGAHDTSVLTPIKFRRLLADQEIGFPLISEREIQDRSKGDGLSKALVVLQTTWFISQCISRKVQGLTITEIELVTVAFAFLNGIMYFLWWSKPVDVTTSVRIYRLTSPIPHPPAISIAREPEIPSSSIKIRITTSVTTRETGSSGGLRSSLFQFCNDQSRRSTIAHKFNANSPNNNSANGTCLTTYIGFHPTCRVEASTFAADSALF